MFAIAIGIFFLILLIVVLSFVLMQLMSFKSELNQRLAETNRALEDTHKTVGLRLDNATNIIGNVQRSLGVLEKTNQQIIEISKDITSLQELLRAPKFRGEVGETMLENLLLQVLPKECFQTQYQFKNGQTVDAIIRIGKNLVPIDAKFPLENFQKILAAANDEEKKIYRKKFINDVKMRVDEIANRYILPQEGTFDFSLMYIPAENIYYEIIIKEDILDFAMSKKVIPVSPNTFYAYLQVICLGLKGLNIERDAKKILAALSNLDVDLDKFKEDFRLLGSHISNANVKYDDAQRRLERFSDRLTSSQKLKEME